MQAGDISLWLNTGEVRVISDIEGGQLQHFVQKNDNIPYNGKVIVCGDLIDSTVSAEPIAPFERISFNIRNLIKCVTDQNILYVFGNRDLNKIKVYHLSTLKHSSPQSDGYFAKFNLGTLGSDELLKAYENLKSEFHSENITYQSTMDHWYTFWAAGLARKGQRNWANPVIYKDNPFLKRFKDIFGRDNAEGTMSADNLLKTIPIELNIPLNMDNDYKAFIVLYVFRIMLMPDSYPITPKFNILNIPSLRGLLRDFYAKGSGILYANNSLKKELLIFSHGGLTSKFSQQHFINIFKQILALSNQLTSASDVNFQTGGNAHSLQSIITNIIQFNIFLKNQIEFVLSEFNPTYLDPKPSTSMLFLLIITAPFDCNLFTTKLKPGTINNCGLILPSADLGPIVTGIRELIRLPLHLTDYNLIQVFGHYSAGIGASIANVSGQQQHKSLLVNLDVTNTFSHSVNNVDMSKTMLIFSNRKITVYTYLIPQHIPRLYRNPKAPLRFPQTLNPIEPILIQQDLHNLDKIQDYITRRIYDNPQSLLSYSRLFFHGIDMTNRHAIFTLNKNKYGWPFVAKSIFIDLHTVPDWLKSIIEESNF